ncbi:Sorbosone dehydrogenase-domain-containing protein [Tribonema minus]|uniref:Sorbosone dehydrogenase-domain-containing protein n=1 Tax=Tribonema minus TaxID=303371 RepID=A0A836CL62_9STRA|nr:Sorbosone dehydrogenase-domain-containing protein [Tribonema minus]
MRAYLTLVCAAVAAAHPLCLDNACPSTAVQPALTFCTDVKANPNGSCCDATEERAVKAQYYDSHVLSNACEPYQRQVACASCDPFAVHLFASGNSGEVGFCSSFCASYFTACKADLGLPDDFCAVHATDSPYCFPYIEPAIPPSMTLEPFFQKITLPPQTVGVFMRPDTKAWWIIDQRGRILEVQNDPQATSMRTILDIQGRVNQGTNGAQGELGLLGLAFSPDFTTTKRYFINYVNNTMSSVVARYSLNSGNIETKLVTFKQPYQNHNGGTLLFKLSDIRAHYNGGGANDPKHNTQNLDSKLGKILRIRLSSAGAGFTVPPDNVKNSKGETTLVYAYGMRNPWKCSFDWLTDDLYCGDVGQETREEIDVITRGANYGWSNYEGTQYNNSPSISYTKPLYEYCHTQCAAVSGSCIIGGYMYRGSLYADVYNGNYIYADYSAKSLLRMYTGADGLKTSSVIAVTGWLISSLAQDNSRELYAVRYGDGSNLYAIPGSAGDPTCANGIRVGSTCCAKSCGSCTGTGCDTRPGGRLSCCTSGITETGRRCSTTTAPCII